MVNAKVIFGYWKEDSSEAEQLDGTLEIIRYLSRVALIDDTMAIRELVVLDVVCVDRDGNKNIVPDDTHWIALYAAGKELYFACERAKKKCWMITDKKTFEITTATTERMHVVNLLISIAQLLRIARTGDTMTYLAGDFNQHEKELIDKLQKSYKEVPVVKTYKKDDPTSSKEVWTDKEGNEFVVNKRMP